MRARVIFFDMDGTLVWVPGSSQADWFAQQMEALGLTVARERLAYAYARAQERWHREIRPHLGFSTESFVEWNKLILEELGFDGELTQLAVKIQSYWEDPADELFPEVPEVLAELRRRGIALGIVSHRPLIGIDRSLEKHRLKGFFQWCASPDSMGIAHGKLDRAFWAALLQRAGVSPDEAVHVGDDFETDIRGARRAGLHAVWIERPELDHRLFPGRLWGGDPQDVLLGEHPCARVRDLRDLPRLLD